MGNKLLDSFEDSVVCVAIVNSYQQKGKHSQLGHSIFE